MTDELHKNGQPLGEGGYLPSADELAQEELRFLAAVERAMDGEVSIHPSAGSSSKDPRERPVRSFLLLMATPRNLRAAAVAAVALLTCMGVWVALRPIQEVEAGEYGGVTGVITNTLTNRAQQGIEFRRIQPPTGESNTTQIASVSNAMGVFELPAPKTASGDTYEYSFAGKLLGNLNVGLGDDQVNGVEPLQVAIEPARLLLKEAVDIKPGEVVEDVLPGVRLELDASARQNWVGTISRDNNWPACFCYGRVLDGIYRLDGDLTDGLTISVQIDQEHMRELHGSVTELELITHSDTYTQADSGLHNGVDGGFHRGWFVTDNPLGGFSRGPELRVETSGNKHYAQWQPRNAEPYALMLKPVRDGVPLAAWLIGPQQGEAPVQAAAIIGLFEQEHSANTLFWSTYTAADGAEDNFDNYPGIYGNFQYLGNHNARAERASGSVAAQGQLELDELRKMPGTYNMSSLDFTLANPAKYAPVTANFSVAAPSLQIIIECAGIGSIAHCSIAGTLPKLTEQIKWDIGQDGSVNAFGPEADFPVPAAGEYRVRAILKPVAGPAVIIDSALDIGPPNVIGFIPSHAVNGPVIKGQETTPSTNSSLRTMTVNSVANPSHLAFTTNSYAGPLLYVQLPADFKGVPLREIRSFFYASPRGGDTDRLFISPFAALVKSTDFGKSMPFDLSEVGGGGHLLGINHASSSSWEVYLALRAHENFPTRGAREFYQSDRLHSPNNVARIKAMGIDVLNLPSEEDLVAILQRYRDSKYFCQIPVTAEKQELKFTVDLRSEKIPAEAEGMLVGALAETRNLLYSAQWEMYSGPDCRARVELETVDGRKLTRYFDYTNFQSN